MTPATLNKAQQAAENRAYVRALLWKRQPAFAAVLAAAEQSLFSPGRPCRHCLAVPVADGHVAATCTVRVRLLGLTGWDS
jgi:hypothetical protein